MPLRLRLAILLNFIVFCGCTSNATPVTKPLKEESPPTTVPTEKKPESTKSENSPAFPVELLEKNRVFTARHVGSLKAPTVTSLSVPAIPNGAAVWGSTGRDHTGRLYFGVSVMSDLEPSAHLLMLDPASNQIVDRGGVIEELRRANQYRVGMGQNKIHTRIIQAVDGFVYFASMDEAGENDDGSKLPTYGSHLWRMPAGDGPWQHLGSVPEGIIAAATGGKYVYFFGYYGHVLFQYDTTAGKITQRLVVGSSGGHISRNIIADHRGHVYVPWVKGTDARILEFDEQLREVSSTRLSDYSTTPDASSHGIVGVVTLKNGDILFTTDRGRLYRIETSPDGAAFIDLGRIHPSGKECYCSSLFTDDGETVIYGIAPRPDSPQENYDWIAFDLVSKKPQATPVNIPRLSKDFPLISVYGNMTRDDSGNYYAVGRYVQGDKSIPAVWQLKP